ncbi:alpha/beta hydrolase [Oerskovia jenensis]|uniref:Enterochelin esterase-like enzyme n=1 Tax=Oerskovia jenensis TaxID=162169 RepID=A0ABS2LE68_9CELL|nr:alpha/beta hydrolase-fold protein [Oerskovia jenensis]MBM7478719.1 enterochelin esterase-like enzyme [Oerskovia jenensis]
MSPFHVLPDAAPLPEPEIAPTLPPAVLRELAGRSDWVSSWWTVGLLAAAAVLVAVLVAWDRRRGAGARRDASTGADGDGDTEGRGGGSGSGSGSGSGKRTGRRHGAWRAWVGTVASGLLVVLAVTAAVNAYAGYVPNVAAVRITMAGWGLADPPPSHRDEPSQHDGSSTTGSVTATPVEAPDLRMAAGTTWVYTPPGFDPSAATRYPVVYLFHGSPGQPSDWFAAADSANVMDTLLGAGLVRPMILVAVDVNGTGPSSRDTECLDSTTGGAQVETYVTDVVVPWVDQSFPTVPDREHRAIGGMSSGGFCALNLGLRHLDTFGAIMALEPYGDPGEGGRRMLATQEEFDANSPSRYVPTMDFPEPVAVFLDGGTESPRVDREANRRLAAALVERGQTVELREEKGQGHTWAMVHAGLPYGLSFLSEHLAQP